MSCKCLAPIMYNPFTGGYDCSGCGKDTTIEEYSLFGFDFEPKDGKIVGVEKKCSCGAEIVYGPISPHSHWCDKNK